MSENALFYWDYGLFKRKRVGHFKKAIRKEKGVCRTSLPCVGV